MSIVKGIKIYSSPNIDCSQSRIWCNDGTISVSSCSHFNNSYSQNGFLPADNWRSLSALEYSLIYTMKYPQDLSNSVYLVNIPQKVLQPLQKLEIDNLTSQQERKRLVRNPEYFTALTVVTNYLKSASVLTKSLTNCGIGLNPPQLQTVTYDPTKKEYIGLHLDSWDLKPLTQRDRSTNRICINLGLSDRFFLFINLTLMDIYQILKQGKLEPNNCWEYLEWKMQRYTLRHNEAINRISPPNLIQQFMTCYPEYPVIKLRIAPGEAYIAPTENMIHDGCSLGQEVADIHLTYRGFIQIPPI